MTETLRLISDRTDTPLGEMIVVGDSDGALRAAYWTEGDGRLRRSLDLQYGRGGYALEDGPLPRLTDAYARYYDGDRRAFDGVVVATGGTPFQRGVWAALRTIAFGETISYAELARRVGSPAAVRAVGTANGSNPINVVVPCHRVIGSDNTLTGYGGGIERKRWLLAHEGALPEREAAAAAAQLDFGFPRS